MTANPTPLPPEGVTQADRAFVMRWQKFLKHRYDQKLMDAGRYDLDPIVLAAAHHRIAATSAEAMVRYFHQAADAQEALAKAEAANARLKEVIQEAIDCIAHLKPERARFKLEQVRTALDQGAEG